MHFTIDSNNIIKNFHIEKWDSLALGQPLVKEIEKYTGKKDDEFILFALKKYLFLKLRMLFSMGPEGTVMFWGEYAPIYGDNEDRDRMFDIMLSNSDIAKYAIFHLKTKDQKYTSVFYESEMVKRFTDVNCKAKYFEYELTDAEIAEINRTFIISRNNVNCIFILMDPKDKEGKLIRINLEGSAFVAMSALSGELEILTEDEVENITAEKFAKYSTVMAATSHKKEVEDKNKTLIDNLKKL
ncbi:MAG: hypothetical protein WCP93_00005 [Candidatus Berkelbacteria bacterium]